MSISRKARQQKKVEKLRLDRKAARKRFIAGVALAAVVATGVTAVGAASPTTAFAVDTTQGVSSVADARIDSPTLKGLALEEHEAGRFMVVADVYSEAGESEIISSSLEAKRFKPTADAEYKTWQEAKAASDNQRIITGSAYAENVRWTWYSTTYNNDTLMYDVTLKDGSVRSYNSEDEITEAEAYAKTNYEREDAKYQSLMSTTTDAHNAYNTASAERPDLANYTLTLSGEEANYPSRTWETDGGTIEAGDSWTSEMAGVQATFTVVSTTATGVLTVDVSLSQALTEAASSRVTFTALYPEAVEATPGVARNDSLESTWDGVSEKVDLSTNDTPTEGASWNPGSVVLIHPTTGERVRSFSNEFGTFNTNYSNVLEFTGNREATFKDFAFDYEITDTAGNTYRATLTVSQVGKEALKQTTPTDTSKIDLSDPSKFHKVIRNYSAFIAAKPVQEKRYNTTWGLFSATAPEAMDEVAVLTVNDKVAIDVLAKANAGITLADNYNKDPKAQERVIEDASLQAVIDETGEAIGIGESVVIEGVGKVSVIPAPGNSDAVPVYYQDGKAVGADNTYNRPYVAFTPEEGYLGEVPSFSFRFKTVGYGEKTADIKGFWAEYDASGAGSELVGSSKIHLRYDAPDFTEGASTGRAVAMNPERTADSAAFDRANYAHLGNTSGGGNRNPLHAYGAKDVVEVAANTTVSVPVTKNDAVATEGFQEFIGGPAYGEKEYGFKDADGTLVKELAVEGGKWVTSLEAVENGDYDYSNVLVRFVADNGAATAPDVVWVNKNSFESAEGRVLKASVSEPEYEFVSSTLRLVDADGNLVEDLTVAEVGTWKVNPENANILFTPVATYKGTAEVKYSIVDRWVGSAADQASPVYKYAVKPYGAETIGIMAVTVGDEVPVEEIPAPEETPEETPMEEIPEETPEEIPTPEETPEEIPTPEETPTTEETPKETPEETPEEEEVPVPKEEIPVPLQEEVPTPDNSITTTENEPVDEMDTADTAPEENIAETGVNAGGFGGGIAALMIALGALLTGRRNKALPRG